ncbi:MAG: helix-turn-helix domain-containing protein [Pseudonocardia sp.]
MDQDQGAFAAELAARRSAAGLSLAQLAGRVHAHRAHLQRVETAQRWPAEPLARLLDDALAAHGVLLAAWRAGEAARITAATNTRAVAGSVRDSRELDAFLDTGLLNEAVTRAERAAAALAAAYLTNPPAPMLDAALIARQAVVRELRRAPASGQRRDLTRVAGQLSGVLAYAALDLGHAHAANAHAATALRCAATVGDLELASWVRGTQSLIARFSKDYRGALALARAGLDHAGAGTSTPRLLAGVAQSAANLGDRCETHRALDAARTAAEKAGPDALPGLFTFSQAKLAYYGASALMWLDEPDDARRSVTNAAEAIALWQAGDPVDRSLDDEALARVYAATAHIKLGELDAAAAQLHPVLTLPPDRRISWLRNRVADIGQLLTSNTFATSPTAAELREATTAFRRG